MSCKQSKLLGKLTLFPNEIASGLLQYPSRSRDTAGIARIRLPLLHPSVNDRIIRIESHVVPFFFPGVFTMSEEVERGTTIPSVCPTSARLFDGRSCASATLFVEALALRVTRTKKEGKMIEEPPSHRRSSSFLFSSNYSITDVLTFAYFFIFSPSLLASFPPSSMRSMRPPDIWRRNFAAMCLRFGINEMRRFIWWQCLEDVPHFYALFFSFLFSSSPSFTNSPNFPPSRSSSSSSSSRHDYYSSLLLSYFSLGTVLIPTFPLPPFFPHSKRFDAIYRGIEPLRSSFHEI